MELASFLTNGQVDCDFGLHFHVKVTLSHRFGVLKMIVESYKYPRNPGLNGVRQTSHKVYIFQTTITSAVEAMITRNRPTGNYSEFSPHLSQISLMETRAAPSPTLPDDCLCKRRDKVARCIIARSISLLGGDCRDGQD